MTFKKGTSGNKAGRPKGTPNKVTADLRAMVLGALADAGGQAYLVRQAKKRNPAPFLALLARCLPKEMTGDMNLRVQGGITYQANMPERKPRHGGA